MTNNPGVNRHGIFIRVAGVVSLVLMIILSLGQASPVAAQTGLTLTYQTQGNVNYSADGLGQFIPGGLIQAEVPAGSTVMQAFLYGTYNSNTNPDLAQRTIDFDGTLVVTTKIADVNQLSTTRADVTTQVAAKVGGGGGITNFAINNDPVTLDGVALVVVYSNPALPTRTVAIIDGSASQTGESFFFNFAAPLDKTVPGFSAIMSIGSGFSFQSAVPGNCGSGQVSIIDVNSMRLTTCAGNWDDGQPDNGGLITVGGVGDNLLNPPNPNGAGGTDDELYDIGPFLTQGDTVLQINSRNPSADDNLFLSVISITAEATVSSENCTDGIDNDGDGLIDGADPDCVQGCTDDDQDGVCNDDDNCPSAANPDQADADADHIGDACDACPADPQNDADGDGVCGNVDNCPTSPNPDQADADGDGRGNVCDACPLDAANDADGDGVCGNVDNCPMTANPNQADSDGDGRGDACDACPLDAANDADGDGVCGNVDNCPTTFNPDQRDTNGDGVGDLCTPFQNPAGGQFVIGNLVNMAGGVTVNFWGSQWQNNNPMSGGPGPNAFKGFENGNALPACGSTWTSQPGNSSNPPPTIPQFMAVIVSSSVLKNGSVITGNVKRIIVVQTNSGYGPSPGHWGTGQVVAVLCTSP